MLIFYRPFTDPYFNIAAEEYFVKHTTDDICMIWINDQSVIIGKHQNAYAEINYPFVRANQIPVIRRISGGGAVYHDSGNVNFTFIKKTYKNNQVDFSRFSSIIVKFIQSLGIDVNISKRNSLFAHNLKFSGHAEHVFHDRVLHHGTLLFDTDLNMLHQCLKPAKEFGGKAMVSVRSEVGNIAPLLPERIDINVFIKKLAHWLTDFYTGCTSFQMKPDEINAIRQLAESKYKTWEWNFGYSPEYQFQAEIQTLTGPVKTSVRVKNGKIIEVKLPDECTNPKFNVLAEKINGLNHKNEEFDTFVKNNRFELEHAGVNTVTFSDAFFE